MTNANARTTGNKRIPLFGYQSGTEKGSLSLFKEKWLPFLLIFALALTLTAAAILVSILVENAKLDAEQAAFVEKLQLTAGTYDANTIVLPKTNQYEAQKLADQFGARLRMSSSGTFAVLYLPENQNILDICSDPKNRKLIADISPDYYAKVSDAETEEEIHIHIPSPADYEVPDVFYPNQSYLNYLNIGNSWQHVKGGGKTVAIIDTGIDTDHPEFQGRISDWSYNATYDKIVKDWDNDWSLIEDENGHGTAVAGVLAAAMDENGITGLAPEVEILVIKAEMAPDGSYMRGSDLVFGLYYAIERDVDVVNMSFTSLDESSWADAVQLGVDSDILMIASAGNNGSADLRYPAAMDDVIGVGALAENSWELALYSNYGENVNVVAPGTVLTTVPGGKYAVESGTSFAAPLVSAAAILFKQMSNPYMMNEVFINRIHESSYDLGDLGPDFYYGYGALDVYTLLLQPTVTATFIMLTDELDDIDKTIVSNHPIQDIPDPERLYAVFDGWYYDPQFHDELNWYEDSYSQDITLYAKWVNEDDTLPFQYRILEDGTVEILKYLGKRRFITIPDYIEGRQVSSIGDGAFAGESRLRRILLPHYLKRIGDAAFMGCTNIVTFVLPNEVESIGRLAFANNVRLVSLQIGNSLQTVGQQAFANCGKLQSLFFPKTLRSIDGTAFIGTSSMQSILVDEENPYFVSVDGVLFSHTKSLLVAYPEARSAMYKLPDETKTVGLDAFFATSSSHVDLNGVEVLESEAFRFGALTSVVIPDTCICMDEFAFYGCSRLKTVHIGSSITSINPFVFFSCSSLEEIWLGKQICAVSQSAFANCNSLRTVVFEEGSILSVIDGMAFASTGIEEIDLPDSLVFIGAGAFDHCGSLRRVGFGEQSSLRIIGAGCFENTVSLATIHFPNRIETIGDYCFKNGGLKGEVWIPASLVEYGEGMFASCHQLKAIRVDAENPFFEDVDGVVYNTEHTRLIEYPAGNGSYSYQPLDTTEIIHNAAFYGTWKLQEVILPDSVTDINSYGFYDCQMMRTYTLSNRLSYLGEYAMANNFVLYEIELPDSTRQISRFCFAYDRILSTVHISEQTQMTRIGFQAFAYSGITYMRIPASITSVAQYAFEGCTRLGQVTFAANSKLRSISAYFFKGCESIYEVVFEPGSELTSIQAHGFHGMACLERVDFGDAKIENIDNYAFRMCPRLESIEVPDTLKNIGRFAFYRCTSLRSLIVPEALEHIGEYAFFGTQDCNLFFKSEYLPIYLDENWDVGLEGYFTGVTDIVETEGWHYANLRNGTVSVIEYLGNEEELDLSRFPYGDVSVIGGYAFAYKNLKSVILPDSLEQIQRYAFGSNKELQSIVIPANVTFIAQHAFENTGISTLTFAGTAVKVIEQYAFAHNDHLKSVVVPGSLDKLGSYAFYQSGLESVQFGDGFHLETIPEGCFAETKLTSVTIPDCVTVLDHNAFSHNPNLKHLTLGAGENLMIMSNVFYNTGLTSVSIGPNVWFVGEYSFMDLESLTAFEVDEENPYYAAIDGVLYNKDGTKLISMPAGRTGSYTIPAEVEVLGFGAFENSKLSEILVEEGSRLATFGYRAFYGARNLKTFTVPKGVVSIDYYAFAECDHLESVYFAEGNRLSGIYEGAFFGCRKLRDIVLPDTIVEISDYSFYACESLETLPFSEESEVLGIYDYAFAYTGITDLRISKTLYDIGDYAFRGIGIKELVLEPEDPRLLVIGLGAFADCNRLEKITLPFVGTSMDATEKANFGYIFGNGHLRLNEFGWMENYENDAVPESLKTIIITNQIVFNQKINETTTVLNFNGLEHVENVILPEETVWIGDYTFGNFRSLRSFNFPQSLTVIGNIAFSGCESLQEILLPDSVISIGKGAFASCPNLKRVQMSDGVFVIDDEAFAWSGLEEMLLPSTVLHLGDGVFRECENLKRVSIPEGVPRIGEKCFYECFRLESVDIPDSIRWIGNEAFRGCINLTGVHTPVLLQEIGDFAFSACRSIASEMLFGNELRSIGMYAFDGSGITGLSFAGSLESLGESVFRSCEHLRFVRFRGSLETIPREAFRFCYQLTDIEWPTGLKEIKDSAFEYCTSLYLLDLPSSLQLIESFAFCSLSKLEWVVLPEQLITIDTNAFANNNTWFLGLENRSSLPITIGSTDYGYIGASAQILLDGDGYHFGDWYPDAYVREDGFVVDGTSVIAYLGDEETITIPLNDEGVPLVPSLLRAPRARHLILPGIEEVEYASFQSSSIRKLTISSGVKKMTSGNLEGFLQLEEIVIEEGNTHISLQNGILYSDDTAIYAMPSLSGTVVIPEGITTIDGKVFWGRDIQHIVFPSTLKEIGSFAFYDCTALEEAVLPSGLETIGVWSFSNCKKLKTLILPTSESFTTIPFESFSSSGIRELIVPGNVKTIDGGAFIGGEQMESVVLEEGVETIGDNAFRGCLLIRSLIIPKTVSYIGITAFPDEVMEDYAEDAIRLAEENPYFVRSGDVIYTADLSRIVWISPKLKELVIPPLATEIAAESMAYLSSVEKVIIPEGITRIGSGAFHSCSALKEVLLPESLKEIGNGAFANCVQLESLVLPSHLEQIESRAFEETALKEFQIPATVWFLGVKPFPLTAERVELEDGNTHLFVQDGLLYCKGINEFGIIDPDGIFLSCPLPDVPETVRVAEGITELGIYSALSGIKTKRLILPDSLVYLPTTALSECPLLEYLYIPANLTDISAAWITGDTTGYFLNLCPNMREVEVAPDNPVFCSEDGILYKRENMRMLYVPPCIEGDISIPEGVTEIPAWAFDGRIITGVSLPSTLTVIRYSAFGSCRSLMSIRIPENVTFIDENAFYGCDLLFVVENESELKLSAGNLQIEGYERFSDYALVVINKGEEYPVIYDGWRFFVDGDYLYGTDGEGYQIRAYYGSETTLVLPTEYNGVPAQWYSFKPGKARHLIIPDGVLIIPEGAFTDCRGALSVEIPDSVWFIGDMAFADNPTWDLEIPPNVQYIGYDAFLRTAIRRAVIPDGVYEVGCFQRCSCLEEVVLPDSVQVISPYAFAGCTSLTTIKLPKHLQEIGTSAFYNSGLTEIEIPRSIKKIGDTAFVYCESLEKVTLPDTPIQLGGSIFGTMKVYPGVPFYAATPFIRNPDNWDGDFLYCGKHLISYDGDDQFVFLRRDTLSIAPDAFKNNHFTEVLGVSGTGIGALKRPDLPKLHTLFIQNTPLHTIAEYFDGQIPYGLRTVVLETGCYIEHKDEFKDMTDISIWVEGDKVDSPWDRLAPGWHNDNLVTYGDDWYMAKFYDAENQLISINCFRNSQPIRPPYVVLPKSGDTAYTHVGWDLDGDGEPDGMPASRLSDIEAHAVVRTSKPAVYTVKFMDMDRITVLQRMELEYGTVVPLPDLVMEKRGYTFLGWENYTEGMTVEESISVYSVWKHDGDGHVFVETVVPPDCTNKGYTLHTCTVCGETHKTDYVDELWHTFGDWIIDKEPTCSVHGDRHRVCEVCGFTEEAIVETVGHSYVGTVLRESTCTEYGVISYTCSECGAKTQESIPLKPHDYQKVLTDKEYLEWIDSQFSGLVGGSGYDGGKEEYWYYACSHCHRIQTIDSVFSAGVSNNHRHDWSAIQNDAGETVAVRCTLCGEVQCFKHDFACIGEEHGNKIYECRNCKLRYQEQSAYTIRFVDWDGTLISEATYHYGNTVVPPEDPKRAADETYTYTFAGWTPAVSSVSGNATYTATYTQTFIEYTVKFVDWDDRVISEQTYHYGDTVVAPENPTRPSDGANTYTFSGWDKDITLCYGDATYKATYTTDVNVFTVTFKNEDGSVISVKTYHYGDTVTLPSEPVKNADETYTYTFAGWTPEVTAVTGDATYTATYTPKYIEYVVKFVDWDGTVLSEKAYHYGDTVAAPENPTRPADETNTYTFSGWDREITAVKEDVTYTATYTTETNVYTVTFKNEDGSTILISTYRYGDEVVLPTNPVKAADGTYTYTFAGWTPAVTLVLGDATYSATYTQTFIEYTVKFVDWDGIVLSEKNYHFGDTVTPPANPTKAEDDSYTYTFKEWTPALAKVAGNAVYTAVYDATQKTKPTVEIKLDTANGGQNGETTILIPSDGKTTLSKISSTTSASDYLLGDINGDGDIDGRDYIVVKKYVLGTADLSDRQLEIADINGDGEVDGIDYLLIKKHVLGTYTIPEPQPVEVDGPDYADFAVIVVNANGKVQTVKQADGKSKSDITVPAGGYAIAIPKAVLDANEALKNAIAALKANDTVTLNGISLNEQGVAVVLKNASIVIHP